MLRFCISPKVRSFRGSEVGVNYEDTVSCYRLNDAGEACGRCDACVLRKEGFIEAGIPDPTRYVK